MIDFDKKMSRFAIDKQETYLNAGLNRFFQQMRYMYMASQSISEGAVPQDNSRIQHNVSNITPQ